MESSKPVSARAVRNNAGLIAWVAILGNAPEPSTPLIALATAGEINELSSVIQSYCTTWFTTVEVLVLEAASPLYLRIENDIYQGRTL
jgi:hypothetical protein